MPIDYLQHRCAVSVTNNMIYSYRPSPNKYNVNKTHKMFNPIKTAVIFFVMFLFLNAQINFKCFPNNKFKCSKFNKNCIYTNNKNENNCYKEIKNKMSNKIMHSINGNKVKNKNIKLLHWNEGSALWKNKIFEINNAIKNEKPDIFNICEANINLNDNLFSNDYNDYKLETTKQASKTNISRSVLLIKNTISYKRRFDLEDILTSSIWIEIRIPNSKPLLIMGGYRQWTVPKFFNIIKSKAINKQMDRLLLLVNKWKIALIEKRTLL